jgi:hypothetical protein
MDYINKKAIWKISITNYILIDIHIKHNRPDIIILNKQQKQAYLLNITQIYNTKINKYLELSVAMRNLWCLKKKIDFTTYHFSNGNSTAISF